MIHLGYVRINQGSLNMWLLLLFVCLIVVVVVRFACFLQDVVVVVNVKVVEVSQAEEFSPIAVAA